MDSALKQRLLGAAVLIALAVIFVPMFFPGAPQKPESPVVSLDIPTEPGDDLKTQVFDLDLPPESSVPETGPVTLPEPALDTSEPADTGTAATPEPEAVDEAPAQVTPPKEAPAPVKPEAAAPAGTAANARYAVSLGVFASSDNADARLAKAKLLGYPAYIEKLSAEGKPVHGVRVGPFAGRASAEAARLRLKADMPGDQPVLVALAGTSTTDAPAVAASDKQATGWAVQLAALRNRNDAIKLRDQVRKAGFEAFVDEAADQGGAWWRVRIGPRTQRADAEALKQSVKAKLGRDGLVVSHP